MNSILKFTLRVNSLRVLNNPVKIGLFSNALIPKTLVRNIWCLNNINSQGTSTVHSKLNTCGFINKKDVHSKGIWFIIKD